MPPKKVKDLANAPVLKMAHEEQVQLLSDALLREYMHRRGFLATLKAFDVEHPRDANTISSRALMSDLMALNPDDQQRMKGEGIETIMEMLCNLRVERRLETERLIAEAHMPLPQVPANYEALKNKQAAREARIEERQLRKVSSKKKPKVFTSATRDHELEGAGDAPQRNNSRHSKRHQHRSVTSPSGASRGKELAGITMDDLLDSSHGSSNNVEEHFSRDKEEEGGSSSDSHNAERPGARSAATSTASHAGLSSSRIENTPATQPAWMEVAAKQKSWLTKGNGGGGGAQQRPSDDEGDDDDGAVDSEADEDSDDGVEGLGGAAMTAEQREQLCAAFQLLCGFDGSLHKAVLEQGFTFDDCADCALIQWQRGGCDGVIAPIQAFVAAYYYEREVYVGKEKRQRECLAKALCTSLEQAQPNAAKIVLLDSVWKTERGGSRYTRSHVLRQAEKPRTRCWAKMTSMQEVTEVLRDTLLTEERWMKPRGGGVASFLFSLLVSRGVDVVQQELTKASTADSGRPSLLLPMSGRATLGLVNLVLTGRAIFFRHNGLRNGNEVGYSSRLRCGLLCGDSAADLDDHDRAAAVSAASSSPLSYTNATEPQFPSWVVWHRESFANLYMPKDTRQLFQQKLNLGGNASVDLVYWDAATEDEEFPLTVTVRSIVFGAGSGSGGGARNAKSFVNTAITSVPAWSSAVIDWRGKAPLRD
ncbi:protein of unknown function (DUF4205), putative [Leishmania donovani]|uniref:Probable ubiquitin carboxyl-terminal hydrolase MINDY-4 n=1 Tax=Leishmania donovani TaxID=5661 RepID=A0A3S7X9A6_LEIDO|nr:protein of unknown function (DUF4205), putative [Leishmania donovani]